MVLSALSSSVQRLAHAQQCEKEGTHGSYWSNKSLLTFTNVDAQVLEAWQQKAGDPDGQVGRWLKYGAPAGIPNPLLDPGIFPTTDRPAELRPEQLHCDELQFRNYAGVEEQEITDSELQLHLEEEHLIAFDTYDELKE